MTEEKKQEQTKAEEKKEEKKVEQVKTEKKEAKKVELTDSMKSVVDTLEKMTVLELSDLVKALEDKFGVSAQAPMAAMPAMAGAAGGAQAQAEEKTSFTVVLSDVGSNKIQVIKEIRGITTLGLKEAKDLVESAPKPIKDGATKEEADKIKAQLEKAGAKVELK